MHNDTNHNLEYDSPLITSAAVPHHDGRLIVVAGQHPGDTTDFVCRLRLQLPLPGEPPRPICNSCGLAYRKQNRFLRVRRARDGGLVIRFVDPEIGFNRAESQSRTNAYDDVHVPPGVFGLDVGDDQLADLAQLVRELDDAEIAVFFDLVFRSEDCRVTWRRLRAFATRRFKHCDPFDRNACHAVITKGPPRSIFQWAAPLFTALYGLGFSYRRILSVIPLAFGGQTGVHTTVGRKIAATIDEEGEALHERNRWKFCCDYFENPQSMSWHVGVKGIFDQRTYEWLAGLGRGYPDRFSVHLGPEC